MDQTDEKDVPSDISCFWQLSPFNCDERICGQQNLFSCGDGQCIKESERHLFLAPSQYLNYKSDRNQNCLSLRQLYFRCETSTPVHMWTLPSGMCWWFEEKTNIFHPYNSCKQNCNSEIICDFLLRCLLSEGQHINCQCHSTYTCMPIIEKNCPRFIAYPNRPLLTPYLTLIYGRDDSGRGIQELFGYVLTGRIKCRGYHIHFKENITIMNFTDLIFHPIRLEHFLCSSSKSIRNNSKLTRYYDINCYNDSKTFTGYSYRFLNICSECISAYRINDGIIDCWFEQDEKQYNLPFHTCERQNKYRFTCSPTESMMCLQIRTIGNEKLDCYNGFDELAFGNEIALSSIICNTHHEQKRQCYNLKHYIEHNHTNDLFMRNPFLTYCDTFWDLGEGFDELTENCQQFWICPKNFYRCLTGQCIPTSWICDKEWDCSDGSDEEGILIIQNLSLHNRYLRLNDLKKQCSFYNDKKPFSSWCDLSYQYPCLLANVENPLHLFNSRPCINITQIGDGKIDCYGGLDERNLLSHCNQRNQIGLDFRCSSTNTCIPYDRLCLDRCSNQEDDILCFGNRTNRKTCQGLKDAVCFDGTCVHYLRCDGRHQCPHGEDEYWCDYTRNFEQLSYRLNKRLTKKNSINLTVLPSLITRTRRALIESELSQAKMQFHCNRGISMKLSNNTIVCFCSPAYYGSKCQYYSDRLTIFTHVDLTHWSNNIINKQKLLISVIAFFLFEEDILDYHVFHVRPKEDLTDFIKQRFQFLYPRSWSMIEQRRQRFFNRTDITQHHPFSIRFEAYKLTSILQLIGLWHFPIYFDYLPSFRLAKVLRLPSISNSNICANNPCKSNSICQSILNKNNSYVCLCKSGFYGNDCSKYDTKCTNFCIANAICKSTKNRLPICICPMGYFGRSCSLRYFQCDSSPCLNNGTCYSLVDPKLYRCDCLSTFYGDRCEYFIKPIVITFNETINNDLIYLTQSNGIVFQGLKANKGTIMHQQSYQLDEISSFIFSNPSQIQPDIILAKIYQINGEQNIFDARRAVFKYHWLCNNQSNLLCFHDDGYLCICHKNHFRAECFPYDHSLDRCSSCLSNGFCLRGDLKKVNDFLCLCPRCINGKFLHYSRLNLISCKLISYLLFVSSKSTYWLTSWITIVRASIVLFPAMTFWKKTYLATRLSILTILLLFILDIHDIFYYTIVQDIDSQTICVITFPNENISGYARILTAIHYLIPFSIQITSIFTFCILITRRRVKINKKQFTFQQIFKTQLLAHKELLCLPILIILSALPQIIISFSFACTKILHSWQQYLLLSAYFLSYAPHVLGFVLCILPSKTFAHEFTQTSIAKKIFEIIKLIKN
ncbi:hypothetical protein I4U23_022385 [Adineta vaga]|nr:hypothetical protein I4U23_022385 [Adineta vaga]